MEMENHWYLLLFKVIGNILPLIDWENCACSRMFNLSSAKGKSLTFHFERHKIIRFICIPRETFLEEKGGSELLHIYIHYQIKNVQNALCI
jgi:hypothetical protein